MKPGPEICLYLGDCIGGMQRHLAARSVDVVVTSPPYNLGIRYGTHDDSAPREEYLAWCGEWGSELSRVLSSGGSLFLNVGSKPTDPGVPFQVLNVLLQHFALQNVFHWVKSIAILQTEVGRYPGLTDDLVVGHYKPINSRRFVNDCHEYVFHLTHRGDVPLDRLAVGVPYRDKSNVARWNSAGKDLHCRGNTWFLPYPTIQSRTRERPHPASFPPSLPDRCLRLHGVERVRAVLDPFMGIGNTALAASALGLNCIGFEIDSDYRDEAAARLTEAGGLVRKETVDPHREPHGETPHGKGAK